MAGPSRFTTLVNVTSGGHGNYSFGVQAPTGRPVSFHYIVTSGLITVQGTNDFNFATGVGSSWTNIANASSLNAAAGGLYTLEGATFAGYRVQVHSVAGSVKVIFGT